MAVLLAALLSGKAAKTPANEWQATTPYAYNSLWDHMGWQAIICASSCGSLEGARSEATIYGLGRNSVLFNVGQSSTSLFFLLPSGLFAQNYYHVVSYNAFAIKLY